MSLTRNLTANYLGQAWAAVMGLAFLPLYVHYLGTEALGLVGVFALLQAWLALLDLGITPALNREMARFTAGGHTAQSIADLLRSLEAVCWPLASAIALVIWAASGYLAAHWLRAEALPVEVVRQALGVMGLVVALRFCEGLYRGALLGLQRQVYFNVVNAVSSTVRYGGAVVVIAFVSSTIRAFYVWQAVMSVVTVAALAVSVHRNLPRPPTRARVSRAALAGIRDFAAGMLAITVLSLMVSQLDKVLLSRMLPLEQFGFYTLAATIAGALGMLLAPIVQSIYPRLVELVTAGDRAGLAAVYHQGAQLVAVITTPAMLVLALFPYAVVYAWSGDPTLAMRTAPLLSPLAIGTFLNGLMWLPYQLQLAHGWTRLTIHVNIVMVAVIVPALLVLVPRYGGRAAAWLWILVNASYLLVAVQLMHRRILHGEKGRWYVHDVLIPVGAASAVALLFRVVGPAFDGGRLVWGTFLAVVGVVCAAVSLLAAPLLRPRALTLWRSVWHS